MTTIQSKPNTSYAQPQLEPFPESFPIEPQVPLSEAQFFELRELLQTTLTRLNKKLTLILPGTSYPSDPALDIGIGTPNSAASQSFVQFLSTLGFSKLQFGPEGKTKSIDASPYRGTLFSKNPLRIDLYALTQNERYGALLSQETFDKIVQNKPDTGNHVAYEYVYVEHEKALREVYETFQNQLRLLKDIQKKDPKRANCLLTLNTRFEAFKADPENAFWLDKDALYDALSQIHGNDYWPNWPNDLDKQLFDPNSGEETDAYARIKQVEAEKAEQIDYYKFCQFLIASQQGDMEAVTSQRGIKLIGDHQVAFSDRDVWAYQSMFLPNFLLGVPPDYFSENGQAWGFRVLAPEKLFHDNGEPGPAAELLKRLFDKVFRENPGGLRIDHIVGQIDPWVYPEGKRPMYQEGAGRLYSSPEHSELGHYSVISADDTDHEKTPDDEKWVKTLTEQQIDRYARIISLIIQSAETYGVSKDAIICEDLGTLTLPVASVMKKMELGGVRVTEFSDPTIENCIHRGVDISPRETIMVGSHDNLPLSTWVENLMKTGEIEKQAPYIAQDVAAWPLGTEQEAYIQQLQHDVVAFMEAKYTELFLSPAENVHFFFGDFFGLTEPYNCPGTSGPQNWSLRVPNMPQTFLFQQWRENRGVNLPAILYRSIYAKGPACVTENEDILPKLEAFASLLKSRPSG